MPHFQRLKQRHRLVRDGYPQNLNLRVHRSLSWLQRAESVDDADSKFIFLWIAFNAAYACEIDESIRLSEQETFRSFLEKLFNLDKEKKIDALVRKKLAAFRFAQALPTDSTEDLTDLVKARKLKTALHLRVRVTWAAEELTTEIMALSFPDNALRGSWRVSGKGAALPELVDAVVPSVVDDAAGDLELK